MNEWRAVRPEVLGAVHGPEILGMFIALIHCVWGFIAVPEPEKFLSNLSP